MRPFCSVRVLRIQRLPDPSGVFQPDFLIAIRALVNVHYSIYPKVPPQGR